MKYVNACGSVIRFSNSEFTRQMKREASGEEIDLDKGKQVADQMIRLADVDEDYAEEFLNPTPPHTAAESAAFCKRMAAEHAESMRRWSTGQIDEDAYGDD